MGAAVGFKIPEFKPKYELFLSGYAQIQNIIINKDYLIAMVEDSCSDSSNNNQMTNVAYNFITRKPLSYMNL